MKACGSSPEGEEITDRELLELAAKAAGYDTGHRWNAERLLIDSPVIALCIPGVSTGWNPLDNDGDRYRLIRKLAINIDFHDCCAWKRLPNGNLIQEFWGEEYGDEAHAIVRAAAEIWKERK